MAVPAGAWMENSNSQLLLGSAGGMPFPQMMQADLNRAVSQPRHQGHDTPPGSLVKELPALEGNK